MAEKASGVAKIALLVSIGVAVFSAFQWWNSQKESRINTALEISRNYLHDRDPDVTHMIYSIARGVGFDPGGTDLRKIGHHADFLEYAALLALTNRLDKAYLAPALICDITYLEAALRIIGKKFGSLPSDSKLKPFIRDNQCQAALVRIENSN